MKHPSFSHGKTLAGIALGIALAPTGALAQFTALPEPAAYALENVVVVQADGSRTNGITIVVRNGLIEAMGPNVQAPPDADVLEGDSLVVYPGFVDAQGAAKYEFPKPETDRSKIKSWAPPRSVQSFTPHQRIVDYLSATGEDFADERKHGVVAEAVLPDGRLMPGRGTLLLLRKNAATAEELVVRPTLGVSMSLQGARGVYPTQLFAVMAFIRQSFEDARHEASVREAYDKDPRGMTTPKWDPDYAVLREALDGSARVYFNANNAEDIRNVLELAREYGFRPAIVGGAEAWMLADELKRNNVPVLVSLDFPKPQRWKPKKEKSDTAAAQATEEELDPAAWREKKELEDRYANPAHLAEAGVTFALTSGGGKAKLRDGARKAIEYGLSEDAALAALSTAPASLLGIPAVGRIAEGMAATFMVADGPLFDEGTSITYTFVEGRVERGESKKAAAD
ncbi:MAG: hypothetical protein ACE5HT_07910, partial [Gemmatimonadales bacterium]